MEKIDFHKAVSRVNTASVKWEMTRELFGSRDVLPMWVADMDFLPPQAVKEAISSRMEHGIYGYTFVPPSVAKAVQAWLASRHGWDVRSSWLLYSPGVVPSISTAILAYTNPGDKVLLQSPVYTPFFNMIEKNGRVVVNSQLKLENGRYVVDFEDFEQKLRQGVKLFLLCNPHNPGGAVWTIEELTKIGELCLKYGCLILSDEIHSDLIFKPHRHVPIASIKEEFKNITITCIAPSKTFNLAGLQASAVIIPDSTLHAAFKAQQQKQGIFTLNTFGIVGMEAAYLYGEDWLDQLLDYLQQNVAIADHFIREKLPGIEPMVPEGTYLLWLDCRKLGLTDEEIKERLLKKGKLALEPGPKYGPGGEGFVRMNLGCPQETLLEGLERLKKAFS
ncbi:MalY/PatB family protein [Bacillus sp. T33-2]|uniref:MalY/PatB family protein n=1 Tax=Bacillus sp. T33-2 TaxID=2054168 RepID=UPI000C759A9F|nr:PatB family C-S lyase [Bacillus sp. T33-2]PLR92665.1 cystathionine beta-lyase [Bacillus sp. T33-2]